jgi:phosphonate transport system substrate-binding protein
LTPVFLDDQVAFLNVWRTYLEQRLGRQVGFVQRGSYREGVTLLKQGQLDFAWVCGYPYVRNRDQMKLLAVPVYRGKPLYQSYLIVPAHDTRTSSILDLRGKVFAFSDPDSNSGHLFTQYSLRRLNETPDAFFSKSFFTWAHRKVVEAVAVGLAQGGAVDGYVWDTLAISHPELTARTRIAERSPEFGFPPFVARASVAAEVFKAMQAVLVHMRDDSEGAALLKRLNLDGFEPGSPALFDGVAAMFRAVSAN